MTPAEQADAHDANFIASIAALAHGSASGWVGRHGRIPVAVTGVPAAFFNAAWLTEPPRHEDVSAALAALRATGLPFVVHVRSDLPAALAAIAQVGLARTGVLPCFAMEPRAIPEPPAELAVRRVDATDVGDLHTVTADGFGMSAAVIEKLYTRKLLEMPQVRAFLGWVDRRPVATALSFRTGSTLGVYSIGTRPDFRGRGYGTAMTWHLMADADPGWTVAVLQASAMGRPIYERMGFSLVREFVDFGDSAAN